MRSLGNGAQSADFTSPQWGYGMHGSWFLFLHSSDSMAAVSSGVFEWNCLVVETHVLKPVV